MFELLKQKYDGIAVKKERGDSLKGGTEVKNGGEEHIEEGADDRVQNLQLQTVESTETPSAQINLPPPPAISRRPESHGLNIKAAINSAILYCFSLFLIAFGAFNIDECPAENMITIGLIIIGSLSLVSRFLSMPHEFRNIFEGGTGSRSTCLVWINMMFQLASMCVFFAVCHWVFKIDPVTNPEDSESPNYCQQDFYLIVKWGCIFLLIFSIILTIVVFCVISIIASEYIERKPFIK